MTAIATDEHVQGVRPPHLAASAPRVVTTVSSTRAPVDVSFSRVLVPTDGSDFSRATIPAARQLAAAFDADLSAIVVAPDAERAAQLRNSAAAEMQRDGWNGPLSVDIGSDPAEAIARHAVERASTLVSISTHARGRIGRALFGSVAASLIDQRVPLVAVGPVADRPTWSPRSRSWPVPLSGPVVAYVDGSDQDQAVLEWAVGWANAIERPLTALAVVEDAPDPIRPSVRPSRFDPHGSAHAYVDALASPWKETGLDVRSVVVRDPLGPASGIRAHLASEPGALLVLGSAPGFGLPDRFARTTAARVLRIAPTPIFVVPTPGG